MKKVQLAAQYLMGLIFLVFGLNGFIGFLPPPPMPEAAGGFFMALLSAGYIIPLVKFVEVIAGIGLLANRFVPFLLLLLAPIVVNIVGFHLSLDPAGGAPAYLTGVLYVITVVAYKSKFMDLLAAKNERG